MPLPLIVGPLLEIAGKVLDRVIPDKAAAEKAKADLAVQLATEEFQTQLAQIKVNEEEAKSPSLLIAGWRPAVGWVGVISLALVYWPKAIFLSSMWIWQAWLVVHNAADPAHIALPPYPDLGVTDILGLLASILGVGTMRTWEKVTNTEGNR